MAKHTVELREYEAITGSGHAITVAHQRHIFVDDIWCGYCPSKRGTIAIAGRLPAEIREVIAESAEAFWDDGGDKPQLAQMPEVEGRPGEDDDDENE